MLNHAPFALLLLAGTTVDAQTQGHYGGGKAYIPRSPGAIATGGKIFALRKEAQRLFQTRQYAQAIPVFQDAIATSRLERSYANPVQTGSDYCGIARCQVALGQPVAALESYRQAFVWGPLGSTWSQKPFGDLFTNSPSIAPWMDYAILLARQNRAEDAKAVYYAGLRNLNPNMDARDEPIPLLVVFDPDPQGTVWTYTPQNLEAAALMAKAIDQGYNGRELADAARALRPDWAAPVLHRAKFLFDGSERDAAYALATSLAKTDADRDVIFWSQTRNRDKVLTERPRPTDLRRGLKVLEDARKRLEIKANRETIATDLETGPARPTGSTR